MSTQDNVQVVQQLFAAYEQGDMPAVLSTIVADVTWQEPGPADLVPWAGTRRGREQVADWFRVLGEAEEILEFEPRAFIAQGDKVVVLGFERVRVRATGCTYENDWAFVFTVRDGKIAGLRTYHDTAAIVAAYRRT
ncbi:MAG: nuclear transport factor 2 family protein [Thermomicrobiales bacterium]